MHLTFKNFFLVKFAVLGENLTSNLDTDMCSKSGFNAVYTDNVFRIYHQLCM